MLAKNPSGEMRLVARRRVAGSEIGFRLGRRGIPRVWWAGLAVAVTLTACGRVDSRATDVLQVGTGSSRLEVRRGEFVERTLLTGELQAEEAVVLAAPNVNIWPLTVRHLVDDGAPVSQGDVVVEFDNSQLLSNLEDVRTGVIEASNLLASQRSRVAAEISEATFEVERRRATVEKAEITAAVPEEILSSRGYAGSQLDLQRARLNLAEAEQALGSVREAGKADIRIQQIVLERARDASLRAEVSMERLSLRATRDGVLVRGTNPMEARAVRAGDAVWPGLAVAQLPDLETLFVRARLFDVDDGRIAAGQRAWAVLDAFPKTRIGGQVREIDAVAEETGPSSARRFFDVTIDLDEVDPLRMRPGMSVKVVVEGEPVRDALLVPREALDLSGEGALAALGEGDWAEVSLGSCDARQCVVLEGLEEGTTLRRRETARTTGKR